MDVNDSSTPAEAARLLPVLDADRLVADLMTARDHLWDEQSSYENGRVSRWAEQDWRCLAVRSPGGDKTRTDAGGPGSAEFADTDWLDHMPYVREILSSIPGPLYAARFMDLGPGVVGYPHSDPKFAPDWGMARLHIPVITHEEASLDLDGEIHRWQPGEFWFGDFSRKHQIQNLGPEHRVHLVVDVLVTPELAQLFPADWADYFNGSDVLYNRPAVATTDQEREAARCSFDALAAPAGDRGVRVAHRLTAAGHLQHRRHRHGPCPAISPGPPLPAGGPRRTRVPLGRVERGANRHHEAGRSAARSRTDLPQGPPIDPAARPGHAGAVTDARTSAAVSVHKHNAALISTY